MSEQGDGIGDECAGAIGKLISAVVENAVSQWPVELVEGERLTLIGEERAAPGLEPGFKDEDSANALIAVLETPGMGWLDLSRMGEEAGEVVVFGIRDRQQLKFLHEAIGRILSFEPDTKRKP